MSEEIIEKHRKTVISFDYEEPRNYLEKIGFVYTLRLPRKYIGESWYNYHRGDTKKGDVYIEFIGEFSNREDKLEIYVKNSGFNSLEEWLKKAKKQRYLYKVSLLPELN